MSDSWINRLVVAGPAADVKAFARAASGFRPPEFDSPSDKSVKTPLSFEALYQSLPAKARKNIGEIEDEPADLVSERLVTGKKRNGKKSYGFMLTRYEPDLLLTEVSKLFPRLYFILGWVSPSVDEAVSKFIRNGRAKRYSIPDKRREEIRTSKYKEWGEDCFEADIEADWDMLDDVVKHWDKILTGLKGTQRKRTARSNRPP
jgi:hypothetical protein